MDSKGQMMRYWSESRGPTGIEGSLLTPMETMKLTLLHGPNSQHPPRGQSMTQVERNLAVRAKNLDLTEEDLSFIKGDLGIYVKEALSKKVTLSMMSPHKGHLTKPELLH